MIRVQLAPLIEMEEIEKT